MIPKVILFICFFIGFSQKNFAQAQIDSLGFESFEMQEGDTTYLMKKYFIAFLKTGPNRDQSPEDQQAIQAAHMAHINQMAQDSVICMAGPFGDDGDIKGILIMHVPTLEIAQKYASEDPAVIAGRLVIEIHPWWAASGSKLF